MCATRERILALLHGLDDQSKRQALKMLAEDFFGQTQDAIFVVRNEQGERLGELVPHKKLVELENARAILDLEFPEGVSLDELARRHDLVQR